MSHLELIIDIDDCMVPSLTLTLTLVQLWYLFHFNPNPNPRFIYGVSSKFLVSE